MMIMEVTFFFFLFAHSVSLQAMLACAVHIPIMRYRQVISACLRLEKERKKSLDLIMQRCESGKHLGLLWRSGLFISLHLFPLSQIVVCSLRWQKVGHYMLSCFPHESCWQTETDTQRWETDAGPEAPGKQNSPHKKRSLVNGMRMGWVTFPWCW